MGEEQRRKILEKLLQKAEEKRREKLGNLEGKSEEKGGEKKKRKRKEKKGDEDDDVKEEKLKKKRKKQKKLESESLENTGEVLDGEKQEESLEELKMDSESYPILGPDFFDSPADRRRVVRPRWVEKSTAVSGDLQEDRSPLRDAMGNLDEKIIEILNSQGITYWFPVQKRVIPELLKDARVPGILPPRDLCIAAPTGSGKTLCYVLPLIQALRNRLVPRIRALVMLPVHELATQVHAVFETYTAGTNLRTALINGQKDLEGEREFLLRQIPDLVVATPGRLLDHLWRSEEEEEEANKSVNCPPDSSDRYLDLRYLRYLVVDEADRMIRDCRFDWISEVERAVYGNSEENESWRFREKAGSLAIRRLKSVKIPLQKILLSATLSEDPEQLHRWNLFQPKLFAGTSTESMTSSAPDSTVSGRPTLPKELRQFYAVCESSVKPLVLNVLLNDKVEMWKKVLCFVSSKESGYRLVALLEKLGTAGDAKECDARLFRGRRRKILKKFQNGKIRTLICSDLVARGMDIPNVDCVISYNAPKVIKTYVHRVGRTARAGKFGDTVTILEEKEVENFKEMMKPEWKNLEKIEVNEEEVKEKRKTEYKNALKELKERIQEDKRRRNKRKKKMFFAK